MKNLILYLVLAVICFGCGQKNSKASANNDTVQMSNIEQKDCGNLDENKIFNDTTWFLPYIDADTRDSTRAFFEKWECKLDDECKITLTLYEDSTYVFDTPCEWDFPFTGFYQYNCDTLCCVRIDIDDHSVKAYNPQKVICLEKYIKQDNHLKYLYRKEHIVKDKFDIQQAPNELIYEKVN